MVNGFATVPKTNGDEDMDEDGKDILKSVVTGLDWLMMKPMKVSERNVVEKCRDELRAVYRLCVGDE